MSHEHMSNPHGYIYGPIVSEADTDTRRAFIRKTYLHLGGAIAAFALLEMVLLSLPISVQFTQLIAGSSFGWLIVLGLFMLVSTVAHRWALGSVSRSQQYMGLGLFIVAEAIIFTPLLLIASVIDPSAIESAALLTLILFAALTYIAFTTDIDFTFMGKFLTIAGFVAMGIIVAGILFKFTLGLWFMGAMILFASGAILYDTSAVLRHYRTDQYVAASLSLFASVALLFWYVLQFLLSFAGGE